MMEFLKDLVSERTATSSKRVIAIFVVLNLITMTWVAVVRSDAGTPPEFMYEALALVAAGGLGLTAMERIFINKSTPAPAPVEEPEPITSALTGCGCSCTECTTVTDSAV